MSDYQPYDVKAIDNYVAPIEPPNWYNYPEWIEWTDSGDYDD